MASSRSRLQKASGTTGKAVALAAAPEAAIPLEVAGRAMGAAERVLTGDFVVIKRTYLREVKAGKKKVLLPTEVEAHINPLGVGLAVAGLGLAALVAAIAYEGFPLPWGSTPRLKDNVSRFRDAHPTVAKYIKKPG